MRKLTIIAMLVVGLFLGGAVTLIAGPTKKSLSIKYIFKNGAALEHGAFPDAECIAGELFIDTDETDDTNCITTADNSLCLCTATDTWTSLENN